MDPLLILKQKIIKTDAVLKLYTETKNENKDLEWKVKVLTEKCISKDNEIKVLENSLQDCNVRLQNSILQLAEIPQLKKHYDSLIEKNNTDISNMQIKYQKMCLEFETYKQSNVNNNMKVDPEKTTHFKENKHSKKILQLQNKIKHLENQIKEQKLFNCTCREGTSMYDEKICKQENIIKQSKFSENEESLTIKHLREENIELKNKLMELQLENNMLKEDNEESKHHWENMDLSSDNSKIHGKSLNAKSLDVIDIEPITEQTCNNNESNLQEITEQHEAKINNLFEKMKEMEEREKELENLLSSMQKNNSNIQSLADQSTIPLNNVKDNESSSNLVDTILKYNSKVPSSLSDFNDSDCEEATYISKILGEMKFVPSLIVGIDDKPIVKNKSLKVNKTLLLNRNKLIRRKKYRSLLRRRSEILLSSDTESLLINRPKRKRNNSLHISFSSEYVSDSDSCIPNSSAESCNGDKDKYACNSDYVLIDSELHKVNSSLCNENLKNEDSGCIISDTCDSLDGKSFQNLNIIKTADCKSKSTIHINNSDELNTNESNYDEQIKSNHLNDTTKNILEFIRRNARLTVIKVDSLSSKEGVKRNSLEVYPIQKRIKVEKEPLILNPIVKNNDVISTFSVDSKSLLNNPDDVATAKNEITSDRNDLSKLIYDRNQDAIEAKSFAVNSINNEVLKQELPEESIIDNATRIDASLPNSEISSKVINETVLFGADSDAKHESTLSSHSESNLTGANLSNSVNNKDLFGSSSDTKTTLTLSSNKSNLDSANLSNYVSKKDIFASSSEARAELTLSSNKNDTDEANLNNSGSKTDLFECNPNARTRLTSSSDKSLDETNLSNSDLFESSSESKTQLTDESKTDGANLSNSISKMDLLESSPNAETRMTFSSNKTLDDANSNNSDLFRSSSESKTQLTDKNKTDGANLSNSGSKTDYFEFIADAKSRLTFSSDKSLDDANLSNSYLFGSSSESKTQLTDKSKTDGANLSNSITEKDLFGSDSESDEDSNAKDACKPTKPSSNKTIQRIRQALRKANGSVYSCSSKLFHNDTNKKRNLTDDQIVSNCKRPRNNLKKIKNDSDALKEQQKEQKICKNYENLVSNPIDSSGKESKKTFKRPICTQRKILNSQQQRRENSLVDSIIDLLNKPTETKSNLALNEDKAAVDLKDCSNLESSFQRAVCKEINRLNPSSEIKVDDSINVETSNSIQESLKNTSSIVKCASITKNSSSQLSGDDASEIKALECSNNAAKEIISKKKVKSLNKSTAINLIKQLLNYPENKTIVDKVCNKFLHQTPRYIAEMVLNVLSSNISEKPDRKFTPPAPVMTATQRSLQGFMNRMEKLGVSNVLTSFLKSCEEFLLNEVSLEQIDPITRLYVAVCKQLKELYRIRLFCLDAVYLMDTFVPFLYTVLSNWFEVLPQECHSNGNPFSKVLVQIILSKTITNSDINLANLRLLINVHHGYPKEKWNDNELFGDLMKIFKESPNKTNEFALLLLCKRIDATSTHRQIVNHIIPELKDANNNEKFKSALLQLSTRIISQFDSDKHLFILEDIQRILSVFMTK